MFYGRKSELDRLNSMYQSERFEFAVIYGRRRVGKTTLIREFIKGKKAVYYVAREASGDVNLKNFSNDVFSISDPERANNSVFQDWEGALEYIDQVAKKQRLILVIDEYPYLADSHRPISSILQAHIDLGLKESKLFLILCGSSMSFMENQVLGYQSPLYGRRTAQFRVKPFPFQEAALFLQAFEPEAQALLYGITGGIPEYLAKIDPQLSWEDNIKTLFLSESGSLYEEPSNLLKQELREPGTYNSIIEAIATGASKLNEIATKCKQESNKCGKYLTSLMSLGIVRKETPINEKAGKKTIYLLDDQMFRFWYRFIFPNMSAIAAGLGADVFEYKIKSQLDAFMGLVFEEISRQYLYHSMAEMPEFFGSIGRWWGNDPLRKRQTEIDLMAVEGNTALFGQCKWTNEQVGLAVATELEQQSLIFPHQKKYYYLFAKGGFSKDCIAWAASRKNVKLVTFQEMIPVIGK